MFSGGIERDQWHEIGSLPQVLSEIWRRFLNENSKLKYFDHSFTENDSTLTPFLERSV